VSSLAAIIFNFNLMEWTTGVNLFPFLLFGENIQIQSKNKIMIEKLKLSYWIKQVVIGRGIRIVPP
jgi:hypothetical protein